MLDIFHSLFLFLPWRFISGENKDLLIERQTLHLCPGSWQHLLLTFNSVFHRIFGTKTNSKWNLSKLQTEEENEKVGYFLLYQHRICLNAFRCQNCHGSPESGVHLPFSHVCVLSLIARSWCLFLWVGVWAWPISPAGSLCTAKDHLLHQFLWLYSLVCHPLNARLL